MKMSNINDTPKMQMFSSVIQNFHSLGKNEQFNSVMKIINPHI